MRNLLAFVAAAAIASPAAAAWNVAQSTHFIIYANDNAKHLEEFANKLERFDQAVRVATRMEDPPVGDGNRLTVFVLPSAADVRSIVGDKTGFIAGFYKGRVQGSVAYVPKQFGDQDDLGIAQRRAGRARPLLPLVGFERAPGDWRQLGDEGQRHEGGGEEAPESMG